MTGAVLVTITIAAVVLINQCSGQGVNQKATIYKNQNGGGPFLTLTEVYSPNLNDQSFDNQAYSACVTGVWLFYDYYNYNIQQGTMEYIFGPNNFCTNFKTLGGKVSSMRFAGHKKNYRENTLTMYQEYYFQGADEYTTVSRSGLNLDRRVKSLIVTGTRPWTLYAQPNYQGDAVCVYPPKSDNGTPAFVDDTNKARVPINSIRSVAIDCNAKKSFEATAFQADVLTTLSSMNGTVHESNNL